MFGEIPDFLVGALFNTLVAFVIVRLVYYPVSRNREYIPSFLAFNTIIYFVLGQLTSVELSVGVGFGLFAIFSVLNYRTEQMPIREMTYLFSLIALPVMNSFLMTGDGWPKVLIANAFVIAMLWMLEHGWGFRYEVSKRITYDTIGLIPPANREELLADLRKRTGLPIKRVEVGRIDFLKDSARIRIFYDEPKSSWGGARDDGYDDRSLSRLADEAGL